MLSIFYQIGHGQPKNGLTPRGASAAKDMTDLSDPSSRCDTHANDAEGLCPYLVFEQKPCGRATPLLNFILLYWHMISEPFAMQT